MHYKPWQRWTILAFLIGLTLCSLDQIWSQPSKSLTSEKRIKRDITYLASDECEGRLPGTRGIDYAAEYIVRQYKEAGLKPAGKDGTYFQPFTFKPVTAKLDEKVTLKLQGPDNKVIELKPGEDFQILGNSASGNVSAPLVFAGYGISADDINFDEYKDLDVTGKVVVLMRGTLRVTGKAKQVDPAHASLNSKFGLAEKRKAAAILLINDGSDKADKLVSFEEYVPMTPGRIPAAQVTRAALDPVFQSGLKKSIVQIENAISNDLKPNSGSLVGWSATIECKVKRTGINCRNTIGVLEGAGPLADETVIIGAHHDHLGRGAHSSRAPGSKDIHRGADDNGSGMPA